MRKIILPLTKEKIKSLKAGAEVTLTGKIYTARDAAHKRISDSLKSKKRLPIELKNNIIYYCGPAPAMPKSVIGACGPTTAKRMDIFTPSLLKRGLSGMIGKGRRSKEVIGAIKKYKAIYMVAVGGAGAYLATKVRKNRLIVYKDLGPEAIYEFEVEDFPVIVAIDSRGRSIFKAQ
ncbi:FumA C-terminus/TtdB family hydratase beta subunit [Candidatus Omnitrophota bacterium]